MAKPGTASLEHASDAVSEVDRVLHLSMRGISQLSKGVPLIEAVVNYERGYAKDFDAAEAERRLASARTEAQFAQQELERGFPVLHSHAIVALWGILEVMAEDVVLEFLEFDSTSLTHPSLASIKISFGEFEQLDKTDRLRVLIAEYTRNSKADLKLGVTRFETVLDLVRLSGTIDENLRRNMFEHQQVRNAIVHRAGVADRRLVTNCPWLDIEVGTKLQVTHSQYVKYRDAMQAYVIELVVRMLVRGGMTREDAQAYLKRNETKG